MTALQLGLIGCGGMGRTHGQNLKQVKGARLRACADISEDVARQAQSDFGADYATTDWQELLSDKNMDALLISTHHHLHRPMTEAAAQAKKHVFIEKPLALTEEDCQAMANAVREAGIVCMVGYQARFSPFVDKLKEAIPRPLVTVGQLVDPHWPEGHWANDPVEGGGNVLSQGCHLFDLMCWLNESEPVVVYAEGGNFTHPNLPITDSVCATIRFAGGAVGSAIVGDFGAAALAGKAFYELFDGKKTATLYGYYSQTPAIKFWGVAPADFTLESLPEHLRSFAPAHGYIQELQGFVDWIQTGQQPPCVATVQDGVRATRVGLAAIRAVKTGKPQSLATERTEP